MDWYWVPTVQEVSFTLRQVHVPKLVRNSRRSLEECVGRSESMNFLSCKVFNIVVIVAHIYPPITELRQTLTTGDDPHIFHCECLCLLWTLLHAVYACRLCLK